MGKKAVKLMEELQRVHRQDSDHLASKIEALASAGFSANGSPAASPGGAPPDSVPHAIYSSVLRQRDVANALLRSSLSRMRRRHSMSPSAQVKNENEIVTVDFNS